MAYEGWNPAASRAATATDGHVRVLRVYPSFANGHSPSYNLVFGHPDFRVMLVTKFEPADYRGFLEGEVDFEQLQPIKVIVEE